MMFNKSIRFQTPNDSEGSLPGTPAAGSVPEGTPTPGAADAAGQELQRKYDELLAKSTQDINNIKSTFQRQIAQQEKQWKEERAQIEENLRRAQMASLEPDELAEYKRNLELEQAARYKQEAQEAQQKLQEVQAATSYSNFFISQGVDPSKLVTDQGLDALVNSGWQGIQALIADLKGKIPQSPQTQTPAPNTPETPQPQRTPISAAANPTGTGPNWNDLIKTYGSEEEVYRLVEAGMLPPTIIPVS